MLHQQSKKKFLVPFVTLSEDFNTIQLLIHLIYSTHVLIIIQPGFCVMFPSLSDSLELFAMACGQLLEGALL